MKNYYFILFCLCGGFSAIAQPITFSSVTFGGSATICCIADMNNDSLEDVVTVQSSQMVVYQQKSDGGFNAVTVPFAVSVAVPNWSIAAGDFDRNGYNDLVLGNSSRVSVLKANADGTNYEITEYPRSEERRVGKECCR